MRKPLIAIATVLLTASAGAAFAAPVTYKIDPNHTNVLASWSHFGYSNPSIHFGKADGTIVYDADDVAASSVEVTLPLAGLSAFAENFYDHLTSADWFDAAQYPDASFKSTRVEAAGEGRLKVTGDLTIRGQARPVVLDVTVNEASVHPLGKREAIGFDASATVKRSDFGLGKYAPNVSDEVKLRITAEAMVPKPAEAADDAG